MLDGDKSVEKYSKLQDDCDHCEIRGLVEYLHFLVLILVLFLMVLPLDSCL